MGYFDRLKTKWAVQSNAQLFVIFVVFAITGSSSVKVAQPLLHFLGIFPAQFDSIPLGSAFYWFLRLLIVFPEKKILKRMGFKRFFE